MPVELMDQTARALVTMLHRAVNSSRQRGLMIQILDGRDASESGQRPDCYRASNWTTGIEIS